MEDFMRLHRIGSAKLAGLRAATEQLTEATQEVKEQALEYTDDVAKYVKKNPIRSLLIATGVGVIVGKFIL